MKDKVVLAYSGGLDTSIIIPWLKENYDLEVIAACMDVGQGDDLKAVEEKAIRTGASKVYVEDLKAEFVKDYIFKAVKAHLVYEDEYLLGTSLARPLMSKRLVEIAHKEGAKYIAHGCTGKGNDQVRFETGIASFDPTIQIIAPWRLWDIESREDAIDYAHAKGVEVTATKKKIYSEDKNVWHVSHEGGDLEDPRNEHKRSMYSMTTPVEEAPDKPEYIEIYFEQGVAKKLDGKELEPLELLTKLNEIAGRNGVGIIDIVENRLVGMKSRGVYETPGGTVLYAAHRCLERITVDKNTYHYKQVISQKYSELVYDGLWFTPLREALDAFVESTQSNVTGSVKLKIYKGNVITAGTDAKKPLYNESVSSFGASNLYDHKDAAGFIKIFTLPSKIKAMADKDLH
ncbi:argininosuccinate synthase [Clostridium tyrobutyricum]|uniref:argininosuccinate synthase n=1 Tax=Clostridium tyrobutyricum TaxID=1519 RepID=UPI001C37F41D|nr:argininosuccinate synthase [Clostridium tyrobutyricum]MBV4419217.1 argininosuccinate synthase [Clostridium tyrobutyricum]